MVNLNQSLKAIANGIISLKNNKVSKECFKKINTASTVLTTADFVNKGNWTKDTAHAYLLGNSLRIYYYGSTSSATGSGNIGDQQICTFTIDDDRITWMPTTYWVGVNGSMGPSAKFLLKTTTTSNPWQCSIYITYTHSAVSSTNAYFHVPVAIDVTKFV